MALRHCRHCGAPGVAADAPVCFRCGGWHPNPGIYTRLCLFLSRIVGIGMLLATICWAGYIYNQNPEASAGAYFLPGIIAFSIVSGLFWSFVYPYGRKPDLQ